MANADNERFQEMAATLFDVLRLLESEVIAYRAAYVSLQNHYDLGVAADVFQHALESARLSQRTRKDLVAKYAAELAQFQAMQHVPIGPNIGLLVEFLQAFRSGNLRLFPSNDAPLKDAK